MAKIKKERPSRAELPLGLDQWLKPAEIAAGMGYELTKFHLLRSRPVHPFPPPETPAGTDPRWRVSTVNRWSDEEASRNHGLRVSQ